MWSIALNTPQEFEDGNGVFHWMEQPGDTICSHFIDRVPTLSSAEFCFSSTYKICPFLIEQYQNLLFMTIWIFCFRSASFLSQVFFPKHNLQCYVFLKHWHYRNLLAPPVPENFAKSESAVWQNAWWNQPKDRNFILAHTFKGFSPPCWLTVWGIQSTMLVNWWL